MTAAALAATGRASVPIADIACAHCGLPCPAGRRFCCPGCEVAFDTIQNLGLGSYYRQRLLDPTLPPPRPEPSARRDWQRYVVGRANGAHELSLAIDGLQCGACVWLIESVLAREPGVETGRVNMTTRHLKLAWKGPAADVDRIAGRIEALGYRLVPFDASTLAAARDRAGWALIRALAVAGFAAGNVMLISIGIWAGESPHLIGGMGQATRDLLHWISALVAMPAIVYAGRPFFASAASALRHGRTNMDVPISIGVVLVTAMSLAQTVAGAEHTYFDSAIALLFFLLIGRLLDHRARGRARETAERLLTLRTGDLAVVQPDGTTERRAYESVAPGDRVLVGLGERIGVDGVVERGTSALDASLVTGESLPFAAAPGMQVFAGTINLGESMIVRATATGSTTLLAECVRLIEAAETRRGRFVVLADRVARRYAPTVHLAALATFGWWYLVAGVPAFQALLTACSVLIITCPCALALAVPVVQVIAASRLFRAGVLLKSPTALERLADVDTVVFDKTGTLTEPDLALANRAERTDAELRLAASLAATSRHPLARSLLAASGPVPVAEHVVEHPGQGLALASPDGEIRLGSRSFCDAGDRPPSNAPELWLARPGHAPVAFLFDERLREDACAVVGRLRASGLAVRLISGDRPDSVRGVAALLGIEDWRAGCNPADKAALIEGWRRDGAKVLMVGDGLNDSPSLAAASVSASPATAADISQTVADFVFQGHLLAPVETAIATACRARAVMRQNIGLSIGYNLLMVPLAVAGYVTPWIAAAAMSASSLLVISNSFRVHRVARR